MANRGVACDFLAISPGSCLHPLLVLGAAPTSRGRRGRYTPKGVRSKTKRAGIEGIGYTCWLTRERMKANSLKMIVVVDVVVDSLLKSNYC